MTVYVDEPTKYPFAEFGETEGRTRLGLWAHLWADSREELVQFAEKVGLREQDITIRKKSKAHFIYISMSMREYCLKQGAIRENISAWKGKK